ncbi:hypothetical protein RvY_16346 [Ramazzottius varieornatus]|uniref:DUF659 domain-containing protein n=1 Tax=Ramazzottius varieornatus TaxID=947166 RepID=A0A1D1VZF0_RAMVA|nr:hypothetical protein RvY_16346 [Ramazzottius varieornatus]
MKLNGVENESFHDLIHYLDYRAPLPTRRTVRGFTDSTEKRLRETVKDLLKDSGQLYLATELTNWGIKPQNVSTVQTDNASNMVAAFKMDDANLDQYVTEADELKAIEEAVLQCTMDEDDPLEDDEEAAKTQDPIRAVITKVRILVTNFNLSSIATPELIRRTGVKLIAENKSRWLSTLMMTEGLVRVQAAVESMIVVEKIVKADNLTEGE